MVQLIRFWFGLCLLRAAPQDIPASRPVLVVSVGCYALVSMLLAGLSSGLHVGIRVALLELALLVMFTAGLLYLFNRPARIHQTLAAQTGSGSLLGLPTLLLVMLAGSAPATPLPSIAWLLLLLWNLLVNAHIIRHALSSSLAIGAGVSVLYILASTQIILASFPQLAAR
ncbi:MAG: hypothetical protein WBO37_12815 [Gammaproteobacteria bacterium]